MAISGMAFVNPNIPALKYGRDMEIEAVNTFAEYIKNYHPDCIILECGLVLNEIIPSLTQVQTSECHARVVARYVLK